MMKKDQVLAWIKGAYTNKVANETEMTVALRDLLKSATTAELKDLLGKMEAADKTLRSRTECQIPEIAEIMGDLEYSQTEGDVLRARSQRFINKVKLEIGTKEFALTMPTSPAESSVDKEKTNSGILSTTTRVFFSGPFSGKVTAAQRSDNNFNSLKRAKQQLSTVSAHNDYFDGFDDEEPCDSASLLGLK